MLTMQEIKLRLQDRNISEVARRISVTRSYLSAVANGSKVPSRAFQQRLSNYLEG